MKEKQSRRLQTWLLCACLLLSLLGLTACGSFRGPESSGDPDPPQGYQGTWRQVSDDTEYWLELGKNGRIFLYDVQFDLVTTGSWVETEEGVMVTREFLVPSDIEGS